MLFGHKLCFERMPSPVLEGRKLKGRMLGYFYVFADLVLEEFGFAFIVFVRYPLFDGA